MATKIRAEISERNPYWLEKHRYYELKHFCLQYPFWKHIYSSLDGLNGQTMQLAKSVSQSIMNDPTAKTGIVRAYYSERIEMLEDVAEQTDYQLSNYILQAVTEGWSYDILKARLDIPCCKDVYYKLYRRFFWLLSKRRQ